MADGLLALIGKPKGGPPGDEPDGDEMLPPEDGEPSMDAAKTMAAEDALAALESGDAEALSDALTRHYEACAAKVGI